MGKKRRRVAVMLDLQWPYKRHAATFAGIQEYAEAHGWESIIDEFAHNTLAAATRKSAPYDGVLARANPLLVEVAARVGVPVVNVWASSPARHHVHGVYPDSVAVGRLLAEHLLARGFRSFATLTAFHNVEHADEVAELTRLVNAAGFACVSAHIPQNPWQDDAHWRRTEDTIDAWMNQWSLPMGVYVGSEACGRIVVQACHRRGWPVPAEVAVIAGKNEETLCEHPRPTLTSVEIGYERIGVEAARLLEQFMQRKPAPAEPIRVPPQGLVVRESTDFLAVDDATVAAALRYISAHSHRRIGPDDVAKAVGMETRTLQNYFRRVIDRPIATEIRRVRLERAKRELVQSQRPLSEIARDTGFGSALRMCDVFRRELGLTPSAFRDQRQGHAKSR